VGAEPAAPRRRIRSFVRREGRMTDAQRLALDTLWATRGLEIGSAPVDPVALFPSCRSITLEIGFGMGQTLAELAAREPDTGFIGIEVHRPGIGKLLALAEQQQLANLRVFCADAVEVLERALPDGALDRVLLFFPDPWPKKRHHKRRLVQPAFAELVWRKLRDGGVFHLATDWEPYAVWMLEVMEAAGGWRNTAGTGCYAPRPESRPLTRFELRGQRLGHGVWDLLYERVPANT
jgi:tRNA (guanine-N7-)-methyltransferase